MVEEELGLSFGEEYDSQQEFTLIEDGEYEVSIDKIEKRVSKNGNNCLNFTFLIRKDVDQKFQGRKLFYNISKKTEPSEEKGVYDFSRINKLILTQKDTKTYKKNFKEPDEVFQYLQGLHMILEVKTEFDDYSGKDRSVVVDYSFKPSVWDKAHEVATATGNDFPF